MRPFTLGQKAWEKATVTKRYDERSYEVESEKGTYRRNRVDLREQPVPQRPLEQTPSQEPALTQNKDQTKTLAETNNLPDTLETIQQPQEQQPTPAAVSQRPKRTLKEPAYLRTIHARKLGT